MGYIRMIRSGGIHCCSNASVFLAIVNEKMRFEDMCAKSQLSNVIQNSVKNFENEIIHLHHNYAESTEYFRVRFIQEF